MSNSTSEEEIVEQMHSQEGQELLTQYLETPTPVLANARDLVYRAYKRPYYGSSDTFVVILLANGWYYPTPEVNLYFESAGENNFKLMQKNSSAGFFLVTYHNALWTSGVGLMNVSDSITIQDAYGTHTVKVESM